MLTLRSKIPVFDTELLCGRSFRKIGAGACGAVFAQAGQSRVFKLAKADELDLWNDYLMHTKILEQFEEYNFDEAKIPDCYYWIPKDTSLWFKNLPGLVEAAHPVCNLPTSVLVTERIWPLPKVTRDLLIDKFCPKSTRDAAMSDPANMDCLMRPYLGSTHGKSTGFFFSLRNFKLHLNQMVALQLDVEGFARKMGTAMAIMHWAAKTDARDVEFVLGSSREKNSLALRYEDIKGRQPFYTGPPSFRDEDFFQRHTELWVLDFNQVRQITLDEAGVAQAIEAVRLNDPYLPKPSQGSKIEVKVWNAFALRYIEASDAIIKTKNHDQEALALPRMFLHGLIQRHMKQEGGHEKR